MGQKERKGPELRRFTDVHEDRRVHLDEERDVMDRVAIMAFGVFLQDKMRGVEGTANKVDLNAAAHQAYCAGKVMLRHRRDFIHTKDQPE